MPACRNGRRGRLKICCGQPRMGSSPIAGSFMNEESMKRLKSSEIKGFSLFAVWESSIFEESLNENSPHKSEPGNERILVKRYRCHLSWGGMVLCLFEKSKIYLTFAITKFVLK